MSATKQELVWRKQVGVGPFSFGEPVAKHRERLRKSSDQPSADGVSYDAPSYGEDEVFVHAEAGVIESISCHAEFFIGEDNVIGMNRQMVTDAIGQRPDEVEQEPVFDDIQEVLWFYSLGLTIWLLDGVVVTVQAQKPF